MRRAVGGPFLAGALGALLALAGCGSVTARHTDGGGTGGTHADSSTRLDVAADRKTEEAGHDGHDSGSTKDMSVTDARMTDAGSRDAVSHGGTSGGGTSGGGTSGGGTSGGGGKGGGGTSGGGMSGGGMSGGGMSGGGAGGATGGECKSNSDCMLYTGAGSGCCGVCQPKSDPAPPPIECLLACVTPLVTCGCTNQQCVGSKKQL